MKKIHGHSCFETERLTIRPLKSSDAKSLFELRSSPEQMTYVGFAPYKDLRRAESFIKNVSTDIDAGEVCFWGITLKTDDWVIGTICLWNFDDDMSTGEIGYELLIAFQKKGYMMEAVSTIIHFGFEGLGLKTIRAVTHEAHKDSLKLLKKLGFAVLVKAKEIDPELEEGPEMLLAVLGR